MQRRRFPVGANPTRKMLQPITILGATQLTYATNSKVTLHRDYWDNVEELYGRLSVMKCVKRGLARQVAASHQPG